MWYAFSIVFLWLLVYRLLILLYITSFHIKVNVFGWLPLVVWINLQVGHLADKVTYKQISPLHIMDSNNVSVNTALPLFCNFFFSSLFIFHRSWDDVLSGFMPSCYTRLPHNTKFFSNTLLRHDSQSLFLLVGFCSLGWAQLFCTLFYCHDLASWLSKISLKIYIYQFYFVLLELGFTFGLVFFPFPQISESLYILYANSLI